MKKVSVLCGCLLLSATAQATDLATMQETALNNRAVVQRYITNVERGEQDVTLSKGGYYPSFDLYYRANSLDEETTTEHEQNSLAGARLSWNVFAGFRDKYGLESAEQLYEVEQYRLQGLRQDIQLGVALSYLSVYDRFASLKVAEDAYKTLEKVYRDGKNRFEVGLIGKNELLRFRVDYDNADITMKAAKANLDKSINSLSRETGASITLDDLHFEEFKEMPIGLDEDGSVAKMLEERSELKAMKGLIEASGSQIQAAYADYYPQVDLIGSYQNYDDDYINGNGEATEDELRAQLVVSMNLFRGFTKEATTARAKIEKRGLQYDLQEMQDTYTNDLHNLFIDYRVSLENVEVARRSIEQAEENLRITQLKYDEGLQRESDLLDAISNLSRAQGNMVSVIRTVFLNYFQIMRMVNGF
ncbi:TolC family protein [Desulfopila sp. IMCC35008]|uniref:TolC family protein n=1 Tax=Desulfopila sp. IMCC35008 TaxID=2653858 RepID=UPI0013D6F373|nr:TolC family protein [Desulfopila sp. IMCC35008]